MSGAERAAWRRTASVECSREEREIAGAIARARLEELAAKRFVRLCTYEATWQQAWDKARRAREEAEAHARREHFRLTVAGERGR